MAEKTQLFMKLSSAQTNQLIAGESEAEGFEGQIELDSWGWELNRKEAEGSEAGDGEWAKEDGSEVQPSLFSFNKRTDKSTTMMLNHLQTGKFLTAVITMTDAARYGGKVEWNFDLVITLTKVRVCEFGIDGDVNDDSAELTEEWTFSYQEIDFSYKASGMKGRIMTKLNRSPNAKNIKPTKTATLTDLQMAEGLKEKNQKEMTGFFDRYQLPKPK